jgi:hypothetical protein
MSEDLKKEVTEIARKESEQAATVAVSRKMYIVYGLLVSILGILIVFIISNSNKTTLMMEFVKDQKILNEKFTEEMKEIKKEHVLDFKELNNKIEINEDDYDDKLDKISDNQIITFWELKKLDPDFDPFMVRSGKKQ